MALTRNTIFGIFFIFLMFGSTIAYAVITSFQAGSKQPSLPSSKIVYSQLDANTEALIINNGGIVIRLNYNINCSLNCTELKSFLENVANTQQTIYLEEITLNATAEPNVEILTSSGNLQVQNATKDLVLNNLCDLNIPLTDCALRNV